MSQASSWFLSFAEQPSLCWTFCVDTITQAPHRFDAEETVQKQQQQSSSFSTGTIMASTYLHESFFAIKLLQNMVLAPTQWAQVPETQKMQTRQVQMQPHLSADNVTSFQYNLPMS